MYKNMEDSERFIDSFIKSNKVAIFSKTYCHYSQLAKESLGEVGVKYGVVELDCRDDGDAIQDLLLTRTGARSVPRVFINGKCIGGGNETQELVRSGKIVDLLDESLA